jgi:GMP synthase (glutamine-hydrolysing)
MIAYVDLEHPSLYAGPKGHELMASRLKVKYRLEDLSGEPCLIVRYQHATPQLMRELKVKAVLVSGSAATIGLYDEKDLAGLREVMCEAAQPTLGFCGGQQLMGQTFGAELAPMGKLPEGMPDPYPDWDYGQGMRRERGFTPITLTAPHPLFDGLGPTPVMFEAHFWEIKATPNGFKQYATTAMCPVQMFAHESKPLYATQFHPEHWDDEHTDGKKFLENFFRLAGVR